MTEEVKEPTPGSDEYNQQMADKFQSGHGTPSSDNVDKPTIPSKPDNGQDKFYNAETGEYNWQAHAKELEYRMGQGDKETPPDGDGKPDESTKDEPSDGASDDAAKDVVDKAGLNVDDLIQQIQTNGGLSEDAKAALVAQGVDPSLIDSYVDNLKFRMDHEEKSALDYIGGEEEWSKVSAWADSNLSETEKAAYNDTLNGENWKMAVDAIKARMGANAEPNLMLGNEVSSTSTGYRSRAEMKKDMSNPEYRSNPTFRQTVIDKMAVSTYDLDPR